MAIVNEDFSKLTPQQREKAPKAAYSTSSIDLGRIQRGKVAHAELTVDNYGKSPLIIRRASCPEDFVKVKCGKEKSIPAHRLRLQSPSTPAKMPADSGLVNSRLSVITNDPSRPSSPIRIVGELTD